MLHTRILICVCILAALTASQLRSQAPQAKSPKRLLLVTTTLGFRHSSIEIGEKVVRELAKQTGEFTVVSTSESANYPDYARGSGPGRGGPPGGPGGGIPGLNETQQTAVKAMNDALEPLTRGLSDARVELAKAVYAEKGDVSIAQAKVDAIAKAELALANARLEAFQRLQASGQKLNPEQVAALVERSSGTGRGPGGRGGPGGGGPGGSLPGLDETQQAAVRAMSDALEPLTRGLAEARAGLARASHVEKTDAPGVKAKVDAVAAAELGVAIARLEAFHKLQASGLKLNAEQIATLARQSVSPGRGFGGRGGPGGGGPGGGGLPGGGRDAEQTEKVRQVLAEYLSPEALKKYDAVFFLNTTGELPLPDLAALIKWVEDGHGFIGTHSASDTLHQSPAYLGFLGGEFAGHGAQETVELHNVDPKHPACAALGGSLVVHEEMYLFKNYDQGKVHSLLDMNAHPNQKTAGHYAVAWSKELGKGRVFYTSLGHREDIWDGEWKDREGRRANSPEVSAAFQKHLLGGIRWALGIPAR